MSWGKSKGKGATTQPKGGKGKGGGLGQEGTWVWTPGTSKGNDRQSTQQQSPTISGHSQANQVNQLKDNIQRLKQQLIDSRQKQQTTADRTEEVLDNGRKILERPPPGSSQLLICPVCHTEHHNMAKLRCRNKSRKANLQGEQQVPSSKRLDAAAQHIPKNPLLTNYFQTLLVEEGAVECLRQSISPTPTQAQVEPTQATDQEEDQEVPMGSPEDGEDRRAKAEKILGFLKASDADPQVIRHQEKLLEALPKPKTKAVKATQPLLDCARLQQALSQATEFHTQMALKNAQVIEQCELLVQEAQQALEKAKASQEQHKQQADKQILELRQLIAKKQEQTKSDLQLPPTPEEADTKLMVGELQTCLAKANLPPHIMKILERAEIRIGQGPTMSIITGSQADGPPAPAAPEMPAKPTMDVVVAGA